MKTILKNTIMYKIIIRTDLYNAKRNVGFNPNTGIKVLEENLTLK